MIYSSFLSSFNILKGNSELSRAHNRKKNPVYEHVKTSRTLGVINLIPFHSGCCSCLEIAPIFIPFFKILISVLKQEESDSLR